jgi:hypothetical protein
MNRLTSLFFTSALAVGLAATPAKAAFTYAAGDLVLFFQMQGSSNTVYVDLGNAATGYRGTASKVNFLDISATLTSAFGSDWATNASKIPKIYAGLAGVYSTNNTNTVAVKNGDPYRTLYVSSQRTSVGTVGAANSNAWTVGGDTGMDAAAAGISAMNAAYGNNYSTVSAVVPTTVSLIATYNPIITTPVLYQDIAFDTFEGGVQQPGTVAGFGTFGAAGSVKFALDLYRILALTGVTGQVAGDLRSGNYQGTITVNSSGQVSFIAATTASAYDTWIGTFTSITAPADKLPGADPDNDGVTNLVEFGFGGDPSKGSDNGIRNIQTVDANGDGQKDLTLTLAVRSGATFSASGNDLVSAAVDGVTYRIQGSLNLVDWTSAVSEVTPNLGTGTPKTGYVFKTFRLNAGNGLAGKGFIRAGVSQ